MTRGLARQTVVVVALAWFSGCGGSAKPAESGGAPPSGEAVDKKAEPTIVPVEERVTKAQADFDDAQTAFTAAGGDCASLCKALASMTNATTHLCELAKDGGDSKRCDDAKTRLDAAQTKVKSTCGGCG